MIIERYIGTHIAEGDCTHAGLIKARLAEELNFSTRQLERIIKEACGMTYLELFNKHKLRFAERLLGEPGWKVKDVAHRLGYSDESNFSRAFTNYFGISPKHIKKRQ